MTKTSSRVLGLAFGILEIVMPEADQPLAENLFVIWNLKFGIYTQKNLLFHPNINPNIYNPYTYHLFFGVIQNPIYLPSINRVWASSPGMEPKNIIVKGKNIHCNAILMLLKNP